MQECVGNTRSVTCKGCGSLRSQKVSDRSCPTDTTWIMSAAWHTTAALIPPTRRNVVVGLEHPRFGATVIFMVRCHTPTRRKLINPHVSQPKYGPPRQQVIASTTSSARSTLQHTCTNVGGSLAPTYTLLVRADAALANQVPGDDATVARRRHRVRASRYHSPHILA